MSKLRLISLSILFFGLAVFGQQTGSIIGNVVDSNGEGLPGVVITAESNVLPQKRTTVTNAEGSFRLLSLTPGEYVLTATMEGMKASKTDVPVRLQQREIVTITMVPASSSEEMVVVAEAATIDVTSAELKAAIDQEVVDLVPTGQEYRDIVKLIPGVQYTEDQVRGPSAGGSGQDNVYLFDGVNVTLPLFGTLSAEPSSHDIAEVAVVKGGAKAMGFNRAGGFSINTISKTGTNTFGGELRYQLQPNSTTADDKTPNSTLTEEDRTWITANFGGPLVKDRLFFYASYYGPNVQRDNRSNLYGDVSDFESDRDELFGKLTFSPTNDITLSASYRDSDRQVTAAGVGGVATAGTATSGASATLRIGILEGSWIVNSNSVLSFKYADFENKSSERPDAILGNLARIDGSSSLNVNNLETQGQFQVPLLRDGDDAFNALASPLVDRYGYLENGIRQGGGVIGASELINDQDFFRESFEIGYDYFLQTGSLAHDIHVGYQTYTDSEDLQRSSNGWGLISIVGSEQASFLTPDQRAEMPYIYQARFWQGSLQASLGDGISVVKSEFKSQNLELNDTMSFGDWTVNVGVQLSNDELIGQGLAEDSSTVSGFRIDPSSAYTMYEVDWADQIQPRLSVVRNIRDTDSVYASYARYNPAASSLPRAASWARNLVGLRIDGFFDVNGNFLGSTPVQSSSGKFFQPDMNPRSTDEYIVGYSTQLNSNFTLKTHARHRYSHNFWEDTNNNARAAFGNTDEIRSQPDYIPELGDYRAEVGGSSYVIAELDNSFTKFYEVSTEVEWRKEDTFVKASYVWSHYYGNMDQDNSTVNNDQNIFIGSSNIADGAGRQLWNFKEGNLAGDRRHQVKVYGFQEFDWNGSVGAYAVYQSGQPWETWDSNFYRDLTGSTSDTIRFSEPAGSRRSDSHYQLDLNYMQNFSLSNRFKLQARVDIFNVTDNQTGYSIENRANVANYGNPRSFFNPRRFQFALRMQF